MNLKINYPPIIKQYLKIKYKYPDMIIFYRVGDFYEFFFEDAYKVSNLLDLNISKKGISTNNPIPMAGIPHYVLNNYIIKLINLGESLVICEQTDNFYLKNKNKKLIDRKVVKIITPGTLTEDFLLNNNEDNLLAALYTNNNIYAYATIDLISGNFYLYKIKNIEQLKIKINITNPSELLYSNNFNNLEIFKNIKCIKKIPLVNFNLEDNFNILIKQFNVYDLREFGINNNHICIKPAGCLLKYILNTHNISLPHIKKIIIKFDKDNLILDKLTIKNLGIINKKKSLISILDKTNTYMGSRMLKRWILNPIRKLSILKKRQNIIKNLIPYYNNIKIYLKKIKDLERITARLAMLNINIRDLNNLYYSIIQFSKLKKILTKINNKNILNLNKNIFTYKNIIFLLSKTIIFNKILYDGQIISQGFNSKLDNLRLIITNKSKYLDKLENLQKKKLNINNLKIKYNNIHGYFIQISNKKKIILPKSYIRIQNLKNYVRYITPELKNIETKLIITKNKMFLLEKKIFNKIVNFIFHYLESLLLTSKTIAKLDVLNNLAERAKNLNYYKPKFTKKNIIKYSKGRHPIIEYNKIYPYISNSLLISKKYYNSIILTGPNMGGKSTYLRQTALIILMAYIGSYIPAKYAIIGPIDRIFVRLGTTDKPLEGKSTFMVEMNEIANILNNATNNSLVLIDEIGRGTSTKDGISLAISIFIYINKYINCLNIFSTHYFELTNLVKNNKKIRNMHFFAIKSDKKIIFDYTIRYGFNNKSYGLTVAKLAGLPNKVINIAKKYNYILWKK